MINTIKQVTDVVASTLQKKIYMNKIIDEKSFYTITKENGLIPLIYEGLDHHLISDNLLKRLSKHYLNYIAHDLQMLDSIDTLQQILNKNKIKHIFLKGSLLKSIYPKSYYRGMGDIDILIEANELEKVHTIFKSLNIELLHQSSAHDVFLMHKSINIEIHPKLYKNFNKNYAFLIEHPWDYAKQEAEYTYKFTHEFTIIYLLYHLAKHLDSSGIGLRSILDIGIYINYHINDINKNTLKDLLDKTTLTKFFSNIVYLNKFCFKISNLNSFIYFPLLTQIEYDEIILYFSISGIHGTGHKHNKFENRLASNSNKKRTKLCLLFNILFPKFKDMKEMYPALKKAPLLLPMFWKYRWIKLIFKKTRSTFKKTKQLLFKTNKNSINKIKTIHDKIGL